MLHNFNWKFGAVQWMRQEVYQVCTDAELSVEYKYSTCKIFKPDSEEIFDSKAEPTNSRLDLADRFGSTWLAYNISGIVRQVHPNFFDECVHSIIPHEHM